MKRFAARRRLGRPSARRGSVFILVVAILAVLALLSLTLAYSTRMELQSSRNWVDEVQTRFATLTGVPVFNPNVEPDPPIVGQGLGVGGPRIRTAPSVALAMPIDPREIAKARERAAARSRQTQTTSVGRNSAPTPNASQDLGVAQAALTRGEGVGSDLLREASTFSGALGTSKIEDEAARINVNALLPSPKFKKQAKGVRSLADMIKPDASGPAPRLNTDEFGDFIDSVLAAKGMQSGASRELAAAILARTYGPDGKPGLANVDDNGNSGRVDPMSDGLDNDGDLVIDNPEEAAMAPDADGVDNDRNGQVDEPGESIEKDGLDNNFDGQVDEPGEGIDEPDECRSDPRLPPHGDDQPYRSPEELMSVPGMTPEIYAAIEPFVTVFSASEPGYAPDPNQPAKGLRQLDPNTATAQEIYDALQAEFKTLPPDLIGQFAVNMVDRRDADDIPTEVELGPAHKKYTGFEITPLINEVASYVGTYNASGAADGGDDGQFVELANPYTRALSLQGWRLEGCGTPVWLNGSISAGSYLVVTDNYNDRLNPTPGTDKNQGSLYKVFGATPTGDARVMEVPGFNLPNNEGRVTLYNAQGVKVDEFAYKDGRLVGSLRRSFQRRSPLDRKPVYDQNDARSATPFSANSAAGEVAADEKQTLALIEAFQNQPFRSPLEVLLIPTNYSATTAASTDPQGLGAIGGGTSAGASGSPLGDLVASPPETIVSASVAAKKDPSALGGSLALRFASLYKNETDNFDSRLVDMFRPRLERRRETALFSTAAWTRSPGDPTGLDSLNLAEANWRKLLDDPPALFGQINLNTAPGVVIAALPGMDPVLAWKLVQLRKEWYYGTTGATDQPPTAPKAASINAQQLGPEWLEALPPQSNPRWTSLSRLLQDDELWGQAEFIARVEKVYPFSMAVAFSSLSLRVYTESLPNPSVEADGRQPSFMRAERIIAGDRGRVETVLFRYYNQIGQAAGDRDTQFAIPAGQAKDLGQGLMDAVASESHKMPTYAGVAPQRIAPVDSAAARARNPRRNLMSPSAAPMDSPPRAASPSQ